MADYQDVIKLVFNILGPGSIPPRATKKPKPPSGGFFIMTEYQSSAWEINLQVNHGVAA